MGRTRSSESRSVVLPTALLVLLPVALAAGFGAVRIAGAEPYPALFMPSFAEVPSDGRVTTYEFSELTIETGGGESLVPATGSIFPDGGVDARSIAGYVFSNGELFEQPGFMMWLSDRVVQSYPRLDPVRATVTRVQFEIDETSLTVTRHVHGSFDAPFKTESG